MEFSQKINNLEEYLKVKTRLFLIYFQIRDQKTSFVEILKKIFLRRPTKKDVLVAEQQELNRIFTESFLRLKEFIINSSNAEDLINIFCIIKKPTLYSAKHKQLLKATTACARYAEHNMPWDATKFLEIIEKFASGKISIEDVEEARLNADAYAEHIDGRFPVTSVRAADAVAYCYLPYEIGAAAAASAASNSMAPSYGVYMVAKDNTEFSYKKPAYYVVNGTSYSIRSSDDIGKLATIVAKEKKQILSQMADDIKYILFPEFRG